MPDRQKQALIKQAIKRHSDQLYGILCDYVVKFGMAQPDGVESVASDLLSATVVEALEKADRYDSAREVVPWLLGIALNLIKRERVDRARQSSRIILIQDMYPASADTLSEDELFSRFSQMSSEIDDFESNQWIQEMLAPLSEEDRDVIGLCVLAEMDSAAVAQELGISAGAVRVRLHRALKRLRATRRFQERVIKHG